MGKDDAKGFHIGFDLGGTKMLAVAVDCHGVVIARKKRKTKGVDGTKDGLERIIQAIEGVLLECGRDRQDLQSIGIGCPGPVEMDTGVVRVAVNLGWSDFPIGDSLSKHFGIPVAVLNDVDAGIYGEYIFGAAKGSRSAVGIFPGTGIGGGCVYEGNILRGSKLSAMEIGHIRINSSTRQGGTDMLGTLESEASRLSIASECARLAYRGQAPHLYSLAGTDIAEVRSKVLVESIAHGDVEVKKVLDRAIEQIGYAAVNMVHLLAPDVIVLGGGLVEAFEQTFVEGVQKVMSANVLSCYSDCYRVAAAQLGDDAAALGAAAWAKKSQSKST